MSPRMKPKRNEMNQHEWHWSIGAAKGRSHLGLGRPLPARARPAREPPDAGRRGCRVLARDGARLAAVSSSASKMTVPKTSICE